MTPRRPVVVAGLGVAVLLVVMLPLLVFGEWQSRFTAWATFAAACSAFASAVAAWLTYRSRPLAIRSIEIHSQQMKDALMRFAQAVPANRHLLQNTLHTTREWPGQPKPTWEPPPLARHALEHHCPRDLDLLSQWSRYYSALEANRAAAESLDHQLLDFLIVSDTGAKLEEGGRTFIRRMLACHVHGQADELVAYESALGGALSASHDPVQNRWFVPVPAGWAGSLVSAPTESAALEAARQCGRNAPLLAGQLAPAMAAIEQKDKALERERGALVESLNQLASLPILPRHDCADLRMSVDG